VSSEYDVLAPQGRRTLIKNTNLVVTGLIACLAIIKMIVLDLEYPPMLATLIVTAGLANAVYIGLNGSIKVGAWILIFILHIGLAFTGFLNSGFDGSIVFLAPIIPILTMLLLNGRAAWLSLALVCLTLTGLLVLGLVGAIPENPNRADVILFGQFIVLLSLCLVSTWVVWHFARISRVLMLQLEVQSNTDYLTGLINRRAIGPTLLQELARVRRSEICLSFVMADVDFFKRFNDTNGHQAGDQCLIKVANIIRSCCERATDMVGRFGGEEFVLILPDTDLPGACAIVEDIRGEMLKQKISYQPGDPALLSLTFGVVSVCGGQIVSLEQLIKHADDALYRGKHQGRNCVVSVALGDAPEKQDKADAFNAVQSPAPAGSAEKDS
jgi:diguanylate cyclase (GGDEF)-like protein